ncbi:hypothetical protein [Leptolyngbya sp. CCY15150]|uniref:hypothetical protein n=1 Tax=Leptolyngbya sp. CCY15150 TaxID=2767772 RepID=UPI00194F807D|nr:hypothetical protein [Leptolyngbya sp. CCY15150]
MDASTAIHGLEHYAQSYSVVLTYPANSQRVSGLTVGDQYPVLNQVMTLTSIQIVEQGGDRSWQLCFEPV